MRSCVDRQASSNVVKRKRKATKDGSMKKHLKGKRLAVAIGLSLAMPLMAADRGDVTARIDLSALESGRTYDRFIVIMREDDHRSAHGQGAARSADTALASLGAAGGTMRGSASATGATRHLRRLAQGGDLLVTPQPLDAVQAERFVKALADDPSVAFVQPDYLRRAVMDNKAQATAPDDQHFSRYQWDYLPANGAGFIDTATGLPESNWGGANIQHAWDLSRGEGIVIAVLDTGVTRHPDLDLSLADAGYDFITDRSVSGRATDGRKAGGWDTGDWTSGQCGAPTESSWHGTHVFGAAGGQKTNNGIGMAGTAHEAKVLPVRVLGHCGGYDSDIADAIIWASGGEVEGVAQNPNPAQVINLSLGGRGACASDSAMGRAITQAIERGTTVVVAAGNDNLNVSGFSPANCAGVVAVASTGLTSRRAWYSNYGAGITLAAPGGGHYRDDGAGGRIVDTGFIWSAIDTGATTSARSSYGRMAGTSQASPHVAGAVALMQSYRQSLGKALLTPGEVSAMLRASAVTPHVAASPPKPIGAGILDAHAAVLAAGEQP
jgi:serine protease